MNSTLSLDEISSTILALGGEYLQSQIWWVVSVFFVFYIGARIDRLKRP